MLLKPFTAYVAGVVTIAIAHSLGSGAPGTLGFVLGVVTTSAVLIWTLASRERAQRAGKFLLRMSAPGTQAMKVRSEKSSQVAKPESQKPQDRIFAEVVLALRGLGSDKDSARYAAGQATMRLPNGSFDETFKLAVQVATGRDRIAA